MAFFGLEDFSGSSACVIFSKAYAEHAALLENDRVVFVEGDVDSSRDEPTVRVARVVPVADAAHAFARGVLVRLADSGAATLDGLRAALQASPGPLPVALEVRPDARSRVVVKAGPSWCVAPSPDLCERLARVPGVRSAEFLSREP